MEYTIIYLIKNEHEGIVSSIEESLEQILGELSKPSPNCIPLIKYEVKRKIDEITLTFDYNPIIDKKYILNVILKKIKKRHRRDIERVGRQ